LGVLVEDAAGTGLPDRASHRSRTADLLIAATALANRLPLYTRNPGDLDRLSHLLDVADV
jgi:predicted nucleic acid-binding protein